MKNKAVDLVAFNERIHDELKEKYDVKHASVIFSSIEQARLKESLAKALNFIEKRDDPKGIDIGCGTGNLTKHLLSMGVKVTAADVSQGFLDLLKSKYQDKATLKTLKLNGVNLENIDDSSFDIVAVYSVLHHIPDYIAAVIEMGRICRKGGVVYIDHEANDGHWSPNSRLKELRKKTSTNQSLKYFRISRYVKKFVAIFKVIFFSNLPRTNRLHPRYQPEGDIHVYKDDCISWPKVVEALVSNGFEIVYEEDYLCYREKYGQQKYVAYKDSCSDMKVLVAKKR